MTRWLSGGFFIASIFLKIHFYCIAFPFKPKSTHMNTEIFSNLNWLAILVASLAYFVLGALWYSKALFGTKWAAMIKLDMSDPNHSKGMGKMMAGSFLLMFVTSVGLALLVYMIGFNKEFIYGIKLGLLTGGFFAATAVSVNYIYQSKPLGLYLINNGYHLAGHIIAAIILVMWR
jgi:hypothetical protein